MDPVASAPGTMAEPADFLDQLRIVNEWLRNRFPNGNDPFQIMTRLAEEVGEAAVHVNLFEGSGIKRVKHGSADPSALAKELLDVMRCAHQLALYYGVEAELRRVLATEVAHLEQGKPPPRMGFDRAGNS
jgi:NTP pyrophosphatase (non-canonical NTP hydrolase)